MHGQNRALSHANLSRAASPLKQPMPFVFYRDQPSIFQLDSMSLRSSFAVFWCEPDLEAGTIVLIQFTFVDGELKAGPKQLLRILRPADELGAALFQPVFGQAGVSGDLVGLQVDAPGFARVASDDGCIDPATAGQGEGSVLAPEDCALRKQRLCVVPGRVFEECLEFALQFLDGGLRHPSLFCFRLLKHLDDDAALVPGDGAFLSPVRVCDRKLDLLTGWDFLRPSFPGFSRHSQTGSHLVFL